LNVLIDGDLLVYRCGFAAERTEYAVDYVDEEYGEEGTVWAENAKGAKALSEKLTEQGRTNEIRKHVNLEPVGNALYNVKSMIATALDNLQASNEEVIIHLSGPDNYRFDVATLKEYKGNRDPEHKPTHGPAIKSYMKKNWSYVISENEEADDTLGIAQWATYQDDPYGSVIVSVDKDLNMIPGLHYNFLKDESYFVDEDEAMRYFWYQMVTGDSTDNIPGIPGMGPAKAKKALDDVATSDLYGMVRALYVQGYGDSADAALLEMGRLLWIRREEGELWTPPNLRNEE